MLCSSLGIQETPSIRGRFCGRPCTQIRPVRITCERGLFNLVHPFHHALQPLSAFFVCSVSGVTLSAVCSCPDAWVVVGVLLCLVLTACTDLSGEEASYFLARARPDDISNYCDSALRVGCGLGRCGRRLSVRPLILT